MASANRTYRIHRMRYASWAHRVHGMPPAAWELHATASEAKLRGEDVILLTVGDPDMDTPLPVMQAGMQALQHGDTHYVNTQGRLNLRTRIAALHERRTGQPTDPQQIVVTSGAQGGLLSALMCILDPHTEVLVPEPMYLTYEPTIRIAGAEPIPVPEPFRNGVRMQVLEDAITPNTRAILIANPANPTGALWSAQELLGLSEVARRHNLWVVSDEVYASLTFDGPHIPVASRPGLLERTMTVDSLSKSHAMTGWRVGWVVAPKGAITHLAALALCQSGGLPGFVQEAACTALNAYDEMSGAMRAVYQARRDRVVARLSNLPGIALRPPRAGMFLLIDVRQTGKTTSEFAWDLYHGTGVALMDASVFGPSLHGWVRLSLASSDAHLDEACTRIRRHLTA